MTERDIACLKRSKAQCAEPGFTTRIASTDPVKLEHYFLRVRVVEDISIASIRSIL